MTVLVFEDGSHDNFYPLSLTRPLCGLRCGAFTFDERLKIVTGGSVPAYRVRPELADITREAYPGSAVNEQIGPGDDLLLVNALYAPSHLDMKKGDIIISGNRVAAARLDSSQIAKYRALLQSPDETIDDRVFDDSFVRREIAEDDFFPSYIWELVLDNGDCIRRDALLLDRAKFHSSDVRAVMIGERDNIFIADGVTIDPLVTIDTRKGPVVIFGGTVINSFTRIEGPCVIGENTVIVGAKIREGCSFGPVCRIGGEIEDTIIQGYSNKYHDGFIGHAYIGEWVNLGALTTNSDLRNDYGNVTCALPSGTVDTGSGKVGCFIGDFAKTSIGTLINTGTMIGAGAMVVHSGRMTPPHIPSFSRFIKNELRSPVRIDDILETNRASFSRRGRECSAAMEKLLGDIFSRTENRRRTEVDAWNAALR